MTTTTLPMAQKKSEDAVSALGLSTTTGIASKFWVELISIPPGHDNRMWLFVNNTWTNLPNASWGLLELVQDAFETGSNLQVAVWHDNSGAIVGLVVRTP